VISKLLLDCIRNSDESAAKLMVTALQEVLEGVKVS